MSEPTPVAAAGTAPGPTPAHSVSTASGMAARLAPSRVRTATWRVSAPSAMRPAVSPPQ